MKTCASNRATKRYLMQVAAAMASYLACLSLTVRYMRHAHPGRLAACAMAMLPALPVLGVIAVVGVYLTEEKDEYQRTVLVQSILWGMGAAMAVMTVWGFLEIFAGVPHFPTYLAFPLFWVLVAAASPFVRMRYR